MDAALRSMLTPPLLHAPHRRTPKNLITESVSDVRWHHNRELPDLRREVRGDVGSG